MSVYRTDDRRYTAFMASGAHTPALIPRQWFRICRRPQSSKVELDFVVHCQCHTLRGFVIGLVPDAPGGPYLAIGVGTWGAIEEAGHWIICKCLLHRYELTPLASRWWMATPLNQG